MKNGIITIAESLCKSDWFNYPAIEGVDQASQHAWFFAFDQLDTERNYSFLFGKTKGFWSKKNWLTIAGDVKKHLAI